MTRVDSPVPLMHHDPDRSDGSWITDPNSDHHKETHPKTLRKLKRISRWTLISDQDELF